MCALTLLYFPMFKIQLIISVQTVGALCRVWTSQEMRFLVAPVILKWSLVESIRKYIGLQWDGASPSIKHADVSSFSYVQIEHLHHLRLRNGIHMFFRCIERQCWNICQSQWRFMLLNELRYSIEWLGYWQKNRILLSLESTPPSDKSPNLLKWLFIKQFLKLIAITLNLMCPGNTVR